ncbi:MAG: farnesyl diphosphate synthase [Clostridia bacterium]|nr:farnesyl diphosphate synthase [Clostridia bacterium]
MMNNREFAHLLSAMKADAERVEKYTADTFGLPDSDIDEVSDAMKYSLFAGGKRIRPYLVLSFCRLFGGSDAGAIPFAAAVEMIHTFSLIHDDLPVMDNDDLRRGKPTNHKVYGEATALLAGDALALKAFGVAAQNREVPPETVVSAVRALSLASAEIGMVGGQIMDMKGEKDPLSMDKLIKLQNLKTGALIKVSAYLGAIAAGVSENEEKMKNALLYAEKLGLAFQITDDILDVVGNEKSLGKPIGSDLENSKTTFLSYMTIEEAKDYAAGLTEEAKNAVVQYEGSEDLILLADFLLFRES